MALTAYRGVWAVPTARTILTLGMALRLPHFGATLLMTIHVVNLTGSYGLGGTVTAVWTLASTVSNVFRGRMLDTKGLRRTCIGPLLVCPVAWCAVPFLDYRSLIFVAALLGVFQMPISSVVRAGLAANLPLQHHRGAYALDSTLTELMFVCGPALAIIVGTSFDSGWTLAALGLFSAAATALLALRNPALRSADDLDLTAPPGWFTRRVVGILVVTFATLLLLGAADVIVVASTRDLAHERLTAISMAFWGGGSVIGGFVYGNLRSVHASLLLGILAALFTLNAFADNFTWLCAALFCAGLFCAPTLTATVETLASLTPAAVRGTMFGLHSALITAGVAAGAPAAGAIADRFDWRVATCGICAMGLLLALTGWLLLRPETSGDSSV